MYLCCIDVDNSSESVKLELEKPVLGNGSPPGVETVNLNFDETE